MFLLVFLKGLAEEGYLGVVIGGAIVIGLLSWVAYSFFSWLTRVPGPTVALLAASIGAAATVFTATASKQVEARHKYQQDKLEAKLPIYRATLAAMLADHSSGGLGPVASPTRDFATLEADLLAHAPDFVLARYAAYRSSGATDAEATERLQALNAFIEGIRIDLTIPTNPSVTKSFLEARSPDTPTDPG